MLSHFFALLPTPPGGISKRNILNRKGGKAEVFRLKHESVDEGSIRLWHGTTPGGLRGILMRGFKDSSDTNMHEFSMPGLYTTENPKETLKPYAVNVQFVPTWRWETPYVKVVLLVQAVGPDRRAPRGSEHVHRAADIRLKEAYFIRGYDLEDRGEKYCNITKENATELLSVTPITNIPWEDFRVAWLGPLCPAPTTSPISSLPQCPQPPPPPPPMSSLPQPPPPPPIDWKRWFAPSGHPYFVNTKLRASTWTEPSAPFVQQIGRRLGSLL